MDILKILDQVEEVAVRQPRTHLWGLFYTGLNTEEVSMQIAKVRASLPNELKEAISTVRDSDRIVETAREDASVTLENARKEAERIVAEARAESASLVEQGRLQQERMVNESEILKLSKAQSEELRNAADRDAVQMRRGAEKYAFDVLSQLEGVVSKVMTTIERGKGEVAPPDGVALVGGVPAPRERVRM
jgi:cell division septum initiation protein DivIVA